MTLTEYKSRPKPTPIDKRELGLFLRLGKKMKHCSVRACHFAHGNKIRRMKKWMRDALTLSFKRINILRGTECEYK
jgi:hypothetical protein